MLDAFAAALFGKVGFEHAVEQRLAGLVLRGFDGPAEVRESLRRAARREAADHARAAREIDELLERLRAFRPAVLKGPSLAELWPSPELRPSGDLDLLLDERDLPAAAAALEAVGFRAVPGERRWRVRRALPGADLLPPADRIVGVDLHVRPFRSIGHRLDGAELLARARDDGRVRRLDDADRLLFTYVHAARHGVRSAKWLFDLVQLAATDARTWEKARERAARARLQRPFDAAAALAAAAGARLPGPARSPRGFSLLFSVDAALRARPPTTLEKYALEVLLEPDPRALARMTAGVLERWVAG